MTGMRKFVVMCKDAKLRLGVHRIYFKSVLRYLVYANMRACSEGALVFFQPQRLTWSDWEKFLDERL